MEFATFATVLPSFPHGCFMHRHEELSKSNFMYGRLSGRQLRATAYGGVWLPEPSVPCIVPTLDAQWEFAPLDPPEQLFMNFQTLFYSCVLCMHINSLQGELLHSSCGRICPTKPICLDPPV